MMFILLILPALVAVLIDWARYRFMKPERRPSHRRWLAFLVADTLPLWMLLLFSMADNTPTVMRIMMWIIWAWLFFVLPRMLYYLFCLLRCALIGRVVAWVIAGLLLYGVVWGRSNLVVNEVEICAEELPASFEGYRIAHFSDLHLGTLVHTRGEVSRLVEQINAARPDLVCFTGDLVNIRASELDETAIELLQQIKAPVVSILGNHDIGSYIRDTTALSPLESTRQLITRQQQIGWTLLQDSTLYLKRGNDSISLSGLSFDRALRHDRHNSDLPLTGAERTYHNVPDSLYNITLVHVPQLWLPIVERGYGDLTLSGHVHAMQLKLFGLSPAQWIYTRWSCRYEEQGSTLYINDGIGYVGYPMRIGADPELTIYTLKRCE